MPDFELAAAQHAIDYTLAQIGMILLGDATAFDTASLTMGRFIVAAVSGAADENDFYGATHA